MIKAKVFFLLTVGIFATLLVWNVIGRGITFGKAVPKKALEFRLNKDEKPFVVIIPSYNNEEYVEKNLTSVLEQDYKNYTVLYIDDCSTDDTKKTAQECIEIFDASEKVTLISNPENYKALYNLYYTIQGIPDDAIVIILDGDDWFAHTRVLKELNRYYSDPNIWMSYSQYITYPKYEKGKIFSLNPNKRSLRRQSPLPQIRSFYAGLFKKIKLRDFLYKGEFFQTSWDLSITFPLWEMARDHSVFIPDVLYVYNRETPLNDNKIHKEEEVVLKRYIKSLPCYEAIATIKGDDSLKTSSLIIFSQDRPLQLLALLDSLRIQEAAFAPIHVYYTASSQEFEKGYELIKSTSGPKLFFHYWSGEEDFTETILNCESPYITFAHDTLALTAPLDLPLTVDVLEKTGAYAAFFDLGLNRSETPLKVLPVSEGFFVWDFSLGENEWRACNRIDMTLYPKNTIVTLLSKIHFGSIPEFEAAFKKCTDLYQIGLFPSLSKVVSLPLQITNAQSNEKAPLYTKEELNDRLLEGYKIDLSTLPALERKSCLEIEFYPHFIPR